MSGVKGRSGRRPKYIEALARETKITNQQKADAFLNRILDDESVDKVERARLALPIFLKTMTDKQSIQQISTIMSLSQEQTNTLIEIAKSNALMYKDMRDAL